MSLNVAQVNGTDLHYRVLNANAPGRALVFVNSLGTDFRIWDDVIAHLEGEFPVLCYDKRGHGLSGTGTQPFSIDLHTRDLLGLLDALKIKDVVICGLSVGGLIALQAALHQPDRIAGLVLSDTAAKIGTEESWAERIGFLEEHGLDAMGDAIIERWLSAEFRAADPGKTALCRNMLVRTPLEGYSGTCAAIRDADLRDQCASISCPVLCVCGSKDLTTSPDDMRELSHSLTDATFETIVGAGHLPCLESPAEVAALINRFIAEKKLVK